MEIRISKCPVEAERTVTFDWDKMNTAGKQAAFFRKIGKEKRGSCQIIPEHLPEEEAERFLELAVSSLYDGAYRFRKEALKGLKESSIFADRDQLADYGDETYIFVTDTSLLKSSEHILERGRTAGLCKGYARTLGNLPNNYLHTEDMVEYIRNLSGKLEENAEISCRILGKRELEELGCGGLLAVNQGSSREAVMAVLQYTGAPGEAVVGLVGKGLMFDSGGYHLKSIDGMDGMKYDMCGAAGVLEAFEILVRKKVKKNLAAVLLLAENVISPDAVKMGDVITTMSGKTVEVYNTDAEGRLVLCDGLTWVQRQGASLVIDLATLTYSARSALGDHFTGLFVNREKEYDQWMKAAGETGEKFWRLPLDESYHRMLEWPICADFANYAPGKGAGASVAACFLEKFIEPGTAWIHLDMVGPSVARDETEETHTGASGAGIYTIVNFISENANS